MTGRAAVVQNLSLAAEAPAFEALWRAVAAALNRSRGPAGPPPPPPPAPAPGGKAALMAQQPPDGMVNQTTWLAWWRQLETATPALGLGLLGGRSCADPNACVGVQTSSGKCVCYREGGAP